ncbi:MAG: SRPBCC domain-containing protein, partial [Myxococcales bacterium]|nr:SRPBCC domain-containing protein [Myxococcales bacterium]
DVLRWELTALASGGTRLTLHHTLADRSWLTKVTAGWHLCIDVLAEALSGNAFGRIVAGEAKQFGWEALERGYAATLGDAS